MKRSAFFKLAASSLILGATMAGCASTGMGTREAAAPRGGSQAATDGIRAVLSAEAAVSANPDDAEHRALLGQAYLANGRFASAETSFEDAMSLGQADARTVIGLAMTKIAGGRSRAARDLLRDNMEMIPAVDYGLAMALSGDTDEGLRILWAESRQPDATAKVRQNLAYTLALAGRWREAKLIASQDLSPAEAARRITEWAYLARPGARMQQVAALIGVTPQADPGLPVALALNAAPPPVDMAKAAEPAPLASFPDAPVPIASFVEPKPTGGSAKPAFAMIQPIPLPASAKAAAEHKPSLARTGSNYVVQLGAFSRADGVDQAWRKLAGRYRNIRSLQSVIHKTQIKGRTFHRLAVTGFDRLAEAERLCAGLKAKGAPCFVRKIDNAGATQWVSREMRQSASLGS